MKGEHIALLLVVGGLVLLSDPKCRDGCRTLGESLVNHGLRALLG